ncbi:MAG TPA: hypothetical protein PLH19_15155 [Anaerolineae bacterium]|nr:hypothetical protein [Anaerolineae bacterium]HQH39852.1 hypothetical protein [Anaerolineae bacterium]
MYNMSPDALKKLYVPGSLKNQGEGFVFQVKNLIDSGSISGITKLAVDGEARSLEGVTVELNGKVRPVAGITWAASLYVSYGAVLTLYVPGTLAPGEHTIVLQTNVPELGLLSFPITDTVA